MSFDKLSKAMQAMVKARVNLTLDEPFFGTLALRLRLIEDEHIPTACTNGEWIRFNPKWVMDELTGPQRKALLAHEVMHVAFLHHVRRGQRNPSKWNAAGDYVINQILEDAKFTLPADGLLNSSFKDMSTEAVYAKLPDNPGGKGKGQGQGGYGPGFGEVVDKDSKMSESDISREEQEVKIATAQAAQQAKQQGKLPGALERFVEELLAPQVDWREKLRKFLTATSRDDYCWSRPNRRYMAMGIVLPSLYSEKAKKFSVVVDTSGSIGQRELAAFYSEINAITMDLAPESVDIIDCDCRLNSVKEYTDYPLDFKNLGMRGGGGTSFVPPFEHYDKHYDDQPQCLVYLTDMYGNFPDKVPEYPVLWVSTTDVREAPFGEVVQIKVEG